MKSVLSWLAGLVAAVAGLFAVKRHVERLAVAKDRRELNKAVKAVERQLAKTDAKLDEQAEEKIKTIRNATKQILEQTAVRGSDANAFVKKIRGSNK